MFDFQILGNFILYYEFMRNSRCLPGVESGIADRTVNLYNTVAQTSAEYGLSFLTYKSGVACMGAGAAAP